MTVAASNYISYNEEEENEKKNKQITMFHPFPLLHRVYILKNDRFISRHPFLFYIIVDREENRTNSTF